MVKKLHHYSIENPACVYDEESLTVLKLCGRLTHKVNECVEVVNDAWDKLTDKLDDTAEQVVTDFVLAGKLTFGIYPSGDRTGATDRANIQRCLDDWGACELGEGDFYIDQTIVLTTGNSITGRGSLATTIHAEHSNAFTIGEQSADNLTVRDFCVTDDNTNEHTAFMLNGTTTQPHTGARYSNFENIRVEGFMHAVQLAGAWCVNFHRCRFFTFEGAVYQTGTCNNVVYDHCSFIYADRADWRDFNGVDITAEGGAQNCGISFFDCDFEGWDIAIRGYCVVSLNVKNIYAEGCNRVFSLDSCPAFSCDGGYASFVQRLAVVSVSNNAALYANGRGEIRNVFVRLETDGNTVDGSQTYQDCAYLTNVPDPVKYLLKMENVGAEDVNGNGVHIFYYDRDLTQTYGCGYDYRTAPLAVSKKLNAGSSGVVSITAAKREQVKFTKARLQFGETYTPSTSGEILVSTHGGNEYKFYINAGTTYPAGSFLNGNPLHGAVVEVANEEGCVDVGWSSGLSTLPNAVVVLNTNVGEMIASASIQ